MNDKRRNTLRGLGVVASALAVSAVGLRGLLASGTATASATRDYEVMHTEAEWKKLLTPAQYEVLREDGTERPGSSALNQEKRAGTYHCAACALPVYSSETKFESGTGWPSFWAPIKGAVDEVDDTAFFMKRTAIVCHRCGGHLGHVFNDGPKPTGLRYCMNGIALEFQPAGNQAAGA